MEEIKKDLRFQGMKNKEADRKNGGGKRIQGSKFGHPALTSELNNHAHNTEFAAAVDNHENIKSNIRNINFPVQLLRF